jgi:hypothetical protein
LSKENFQDLHSIELIFAVRWASTTKKNSEMDFSSLPITFDVLTSQYVSLSVHLTGDEYLMIDFLSTASGGIDFIKDKQTK